MRLMLNRHSTLAVPSEAHFLATLFRRFAPDAELHEPDIDGAVEILTSNVEWNRDWTSDPAVLTERLRARAPISVGGFLDVVFRLETEGANKPRWGAKTPAHLFQVARLRVALPDARFVGMVRDPRDAFLSLAQKNWVGTSTWEVGNYLQRCDRLVQDYAHDGHDDFLVVRYEDLVLRAEPTLRVVCDFLSLDYEPTMHDFYVDAEDNVQRWELDTGAHEKLLRPPDPSDVERWTREGDRRAVREIEAVTSDAIGWFGYERSVPKLEIPWLRQRARVRHHWRQRRSGASHPSAG
jgi:hypothetical protein